MNIFKRVLEFVKRRLIMRNATSYIKWLRSKGVLIGDNFAIASNGPLSNITIDITRPSLIKIGNNVTINKNFTLVTHDFVSGVFLHCYNDFLPSSGRVTIGDNVRFGTNCTVLKGVTIGDNCFIGANSVVSKDIPANSIAVGSPCKVICSLEDYHSRREVKCIDEALDYARSIKERFSRRPITTDFWEEFPLFVSGDRIADYPELKEIIENQLGSSYIYYIKAHKAKFDSFEDFLAAAGIE